MEEKSCWICFLSTSEDSATASDVKWVHPCRCIGSTQWVHEDCLLKWLKSSTNSGGNPFRYGGRRSSYSVAIDPSSEVSIQQEEPSIFYKMLNGIKRMLLRMWPASLGQVVTISSKLACPQCKTPYLIVQNESSWILSFLEKINYFGSKTLTIFVYCSLAVGGFSILWVHGTLSLLFMYGIDDYKRLFSEIILNEETLSEDNVVGTLSSLVNYLSFTLVAVPMIPFFLVVSVFPITSIRHAISVILMGRLYMFTNIDGSATSDYQLQPLSLLIPALYVAYSVARDFVFKRLGISRKIAERQLAATSDTILDAGDDEGSIVAAVILDSDDTDVILSSSPSSSSSSEEEEEELEQGQAPFHMEDSPINRPDQQHPPAQDSPVQATVRTIATIRASVTPIISSLFMPILVPFLRMLFTSMVGRHFSTSRLPIIYKNLLAASALIVVKDFFQITYHIERDRLEKSRSVLNYNLSEYI